MKDRIIIYLKILIILSIIALTALIYFQQGDFTSLDLGRHLKNGQIVWREPGVLFKNFYSYTEPDFPFINHHWLAGVIFWLLYLIGGFKILTALNILLGIAAVWLIFKTAEKKSNFSLAAILMLPAILLLNERIDVRPEMFSYFFIALTFYLLEDFRSGGRINKLVWLVPMFLIWVNLHIYFFIGLFLVGLVLLEKVILLGRNFFKDSGAKKYFYICLGALAACLINPNFFKGLVYPFNILKAYGYDIVENKSPFYLETLTINYNITIFKILLGLLVLSFVLALIKRKLDWYYLAIALVFSSLACLYIRNLPFFGLLAVPAAAGNFYLVCGEKKNLGRPVIILSVIIGVYGLTLGWLALDNLGERKFLNKSLGLGVRENSLESFRFYQGNNLGGPIFNNYDLGSALIFWLYPAEKVFVDNRPEAYSLDFFSQIYKPMMLEEDNWQELSRQYNFNLLYLSHTDGTPWARQFLAARLKDAGWPLVYFDDYAVIMAKDNESNKALIAKHKIDELKFSQRLNQLLPGAADSEKNNLANLATLDGRTDLAEKIYLDRLARLPNDGEILASLGYLSAGGQTSAGVLKSINYLSKALKAGYKLPAVYNQLGLNYWNLGDFAEAEKMWQQALRLDSNNEHAKYYLGQADALIR